MLACVHAIAHAAPTYDEAREAGALFERGRGLLEGENYAAACAAFARSQQLDPQSGTLYNLAGCYVKRGMLVSALHAYRDLAKHDRNAKRRAVAAQRAAELDARIPTLHITATTPGWTVTLNGVDVSAVVGTDHRVDPGVYELVATSGAAEFRTMVTLPEYGTTVTVAIRPKHAPDVADPFGAHAVDSLPRPVLAAQPLPPDPAWVRQRRHALLATAGGGGFVVIGIALAKLARDKWQDADALCGALPCSTDAQLQRDVLEDRARDRAYAATGLILGGGALAGFGAWLYWKNSRAPLRARVIPDVTATTAGVLIQGRF